VGSPCRNSLRETEYLAIIGSPGSLGILLPSVYRVLPISQTSKGLGMSKVLYIINFKFQTYGMATYSQTTQSLTLRHVQVHAHTHTLFT